MTMPAGKYYVGDLCYVLHDSWDEVCDLIISDNSRGDGEFEMKDGRRFASYGTKWGDGSYMDQYGREYFVDAGIIGCIRIEDIDAELRQLAEDVGPRFGGQIVEFDKPFETHEDDGKIWIGETVVDTDPSYEDLEEDYSEGDEY